MIARLHHHKTGERDLHIYVPPSYEQSRQQRYPVVYVHDQGELVMGCFNTLEHLFLSRQLPELIFVGIGTENRIDDYTPWPAEALMESAPSFGGKGRDYLQELTEQIKPEIDARYRTLVEREHTALLGCSLGGLISVYAAYEYADRFGNIGAISASFWYEGMLDFIQTRSLPPLQPKLYSYVGLLEGVYKTNLQKNMVPNTMAVHEHWKKQGWAKERLKLEVHPQGTHDHHFFIQQFLSALHWFFGGRETVIA
ncbi:alpha/beta hydrolase [Paenibacillus senegalensis]|uniref:alpha/beta hydrolase n=1 Tax=Paenibacillus senegalensis TaxID=1465766 RepID=UPI00028850DC|nr:alpha/beta hydrolase-fold protein [Paenibacillus senegalensis]